MDIKEALKLTLVPEPTDIFLPYKDWEELMFQVYPEGTWPLALVRDFPNFAFRGIAVGVKQDG